MYKLFFSRSIILLVISILIGTTACEKLLIRPTPNENQEIFEYIWNYSKTYYCCSDIKGIDWDVIYDTYAPQVSEDMDETAFFNLVHNMLSELEDPIVSLTGPQGTVHYDNSCVACPVNYNPDLIQEFYKPNETDAYAMIGDVAYINNFDDESFLGDIIESGISKLIFDFRNLTENPFRKKLYPCNEYPNAPTNSCIDPGGEQSNLYSHRIKTGPTESDYLDDVLFCSTFIPGEIVVLVNQHTMNDGNTAAYLLARHTLVGARTGGGNMDICAVALSNGWVLSIPRGTLLLEDGTGIAEGFDPQILINDDPTTTDKDEIIEKALELLN